MKKFADRRAVVSRIWAAIEKLSPGEPADPDANIETLEDAAATETAQDPPTDVVADVDAQTPPVAPEPQPSGEQTTAPEKPRVARDGSKTAQILDMLKRPGGATLNERVYSINQYISIPPSTPAGFATPAGFCFVHQSIQNASKEHVAGAGDDRASEFTHRIVKSHLPTPPDRLVLL